MKINILTITSLSLATLLATVSAMDIDPGKEIKDVYNELMLNHFKCENQKSISMKDIEMLLPATDLALLPEAMKGASIDLNEFTKILDKPSAKIVIQSQFQDDEGNFSTERFAAFLKLNVKDEKVMAITQYFGFKEGKPIALIRFMDKKTGTYDIVASSRASP
ncbi:hypothetical protein IWQ61_010169 [Dispira simplex]|nr:hypothetical protein IWQ61_010169 [Dispira simplex]